MIEYKCPSCLGNILNDEEFIDIEEGTESISIRCDKCSKRVNIKIGGYKMKFEEYKPLAMRTNNKKEDPKEDLLNACLGLVGEYVEYQNAETEEHKLEELGDIHWYVALLSQTIAYEEGGIFDGDKDILTSIGNICDSIKKHAFQGHDLDRYKIEKHTQELLEALKRECESMGTTQSAIMTANVDKLKERFPKGFKVEDSINRVN